MAKKLNKLDLLKLSTIDTASNDFVAFAAKSDGLYQKLGEVESKLATTDELLDKVKTDVPRGAVFTDTVYTHPSYTARASGLYKITVNTLGHISDATAVVKSDITGLGIPAQDTTYSAGIGLTLTGTSFSTKYGTLAGTAAQGDDSRINNGQTAYDWGNHASAGYIKSYVNTTYDLISLTELNTGTVTTSRVVSAKNLNDWLNGKNYATTVKVSGTGDLLASVSKDGNNINFIKGNQSWDNLVGIPSTFTPSSHKHPTTDITGLGNIATINKNNSTANYLRGDGTWVTPPNKTYSTATTSANGLMSSTDKSKLDDIEEGANKYVHPSGVYMSSAERTKLADIASNANNYSLPTASDTVLGGVKVGARLTITSGTLSANIQSDNNFTSTYKTKLDSAYSHSQDAHAPSTAQKNSDITKAEIETKLTGTITTHSHTVTKANVELGNVDNVKQIPYSEKGANGGVAELDSTGKVLSSQLPSYVDDVLEYATLANFPTTGETGKIYIAINTNLTYRWTGTAYTEISSSIALGETSATAYRGDRGKTAYDHSQDAHAPSNAQKNSDITKAEIEAKLTGAITTHTHSAYVPTSRTVAGKALTGNITLAKADVGLSLVDNVKQEPAFTKNAAFNKDFGTTAGTVTQGNDSRLSDARTPLAHSHPISDITNLQTTLNDKADKTYVDDKITTITNRVIDIDEAGSAALNDLNSRLKTIEQRLLADVL